MSSAAVVIAALRVNVALVLKLISVFVTPALAWAT